VQAIRELGAERAVAATSATPPAARVASVKAELAKTRKWISTCGHGKRIVIGSIEYGDADNNGWSYCNRTGCKDTIAGQWADAPRTGEIVNGKVKTAPKSAAARKPGQKRTPAEKIADGKAKAARKAANPRARKAADSLPNRVRAHREAAALSPKDLAQRLGKDWSASTVRRIERGSRKPTPEQITQLADTLAVPVAELGLTTATVDEIKAATPRKSAAPRKVVATGKRTGKALATKADVTEEIAAVLAG
jgi:ribosome-binding protein aMBF1 (putative translation factor)